MKYHQQLGVNDCTPACLAMIASHYKSYVSIGEIRKYCKTGFNGAKGRTAKSISPKISFTRPAKSHRTALAICCSTKTPGIPLQTRGILVALVSLFMETGQSRANRFYTRVLRNF
jgi:ABC-type bacteriocin/lantibiotic exporter with double-glycine peptidase domain